MKTTIQLTQIIQPMMTSALLKLDPVWDPIRNTPAFQKLLAEGEKGDHL